MQVPSNAVCCPTFRSNLHPIYALYPMGRILPSVRKELDSLVKSHAKLSYDGNVLHPGFSWRSTPNVCDNAVY